MGEEKTIFEYDTLNRVIETDESGMITQYLYDNAGNRFLKDTPEGITLYLRHGQTAVAMDIEVPETVTDVKGKVNRYVLSGDLLAGRITKEVKVDGTNIVSISYYHLDHLNSTKCVSNEVGEVAVRYIYRAFGSQLAKIGSGEAKYTYGGKELDEENGLYYFNARYYDAEVGRFISVDPAQDGWNWYTFCNNNPLRFVDPTGLKLVEVTMEDSGTLVLNKDNINLNRLVDFGEDKKLESTKISQKQSLIGGLTAIAIGVAKFGRPIIQGVASKLGWVGGVITVAGGTMSYTKQVYNSELNRATGYMKNGTSYEMQKVAIYQTYYHQQWENGKIKDIEEKVLLGYDHQIKFNDANGDGKPEVFHLTDKDYNNIKLMSKAVDKKE